MLRTYLDLYSYHRQHTELQARHDVQNVFEKTLRDLRAFGLDDLRGKRVLDLGCGQRFPFALLAAGRGADVTALDLNVVGSAGLWPSVYRTARTNGAKRAAMTLVRRVLFDKRYYDELAAAGHFELARASDIDFVIADATGERFDLPSRHFDLIVSNAVLEHVEDVEAYAREVARLLKPAGLFHGLIHNYFSISGGHNLRWAYPDTEPSATVPPWDHLRENRFPTHVYLNHLQPEQYQSYLARNLEILCFEDRDINHDPHGREGSRFLEGGVKEELRSYAEDLLLTRAWCVICRAKSAER